MDWSFITKKTFEEAKSVMDSQLQNVLADEKPVKKAIDYSEVIKDLSLHFGHNSYETPVILYEDKKLGIVSGTPGDLIGTVSANFPSTRGLWPYTELCGAVFNIARMERALIQLEDGRLILVKTDAYKLVNVPEYLEDDILGED